MNDNFMEMVAVLGIGKTIINEVNKFPYSKCQNCGHKIMLLDYKYNRKVKPYLFHNWQKKCWCGCCNPKMKQSELKKLNEWGVKE